jgi:uncharacterized paraquat-inducible protein A
MKRECPKCHKVKRFKGDMCGVCSYRLRRREEMRSPNRYGNVVRRVVSECV